MSHETLAAEPPREWTYLDDDLGIVYCLGRAISPNEQEAVATYYETDGESATKRTLDDGARYRRLIYQGLPEEHVRLAGVERPEVVDRLLRHTVLTEAGIYLNPASLTPGQSDFRNVATWLNPEHPNAQGFKVALEIACKSLSDAEVTIDALSLYGGASFGLVAVTDKVVEDVDVVFKESNIPELRNAVDKLQSEFTWSEIDPHGRLPERRQKLKAKRWATSQIRLSDPYPMSIDLKVGRDLHSPTLWDYLPKHGEYQQYIGDLRVIDDTEGFCISPALKCEDRDGEERLVLLEGYQYIGCAVAGDTIQVAGRAYNDSPVILVTQSEHDQVMPDFRNVPVS